MINGELIVDNFAGGGGNSKSTGSMRGRTNIEYENQRRADRTAPVCISWRRIKK